MSIFDNFYENNFNHKRPTSFIVKLKKNIDGTLDDLILKTSFLNEHYENISINQRLYHYINNEYNIKLCPICNNVLYYRVKPNPSYINTCGSTVCKNKQNYISTSKSIKNKYGVDNISQTEEWHQKVKDTNFKRRGVEWNTQSKELIQARKNSWIVNKNEQLEKRYTTNTEKYCVKHVMQNKNIKEKLLKTISESSFYKFDRINKSKETNFLKYGGWFCSTAECQDKKYQTKDFIFPSGKVVKVQGYEPKCINDLLNQGHSEKDIIVGNLDIEKYIGKILYIGLDKKEHRYYPDIYVPSLNLVIEVKSLYTLSQDFEINNKKSAILESGLNYALKIY